MNPSSFHALIIDQHLGELSPEASELLDDYLAHNPSARAEAARILESVEFTRSAVLQHPELARLVPDDQPATPARFRVLHPWLARAAVLVALATLAGLAGYLAGRSTPQPPLAHSGATTEVSVATATSSPAASPWARYRMAFDPAGGGMQVVRVDSTGTEPATIR